MDFFFHLSGGKQSASEDKDEAVCGTNPSVITNAALLHEKHNPALRFVSPANR